MAARLQTLVFLCFQVSVVAKNVDAENLAAGTDALPEHALMRFGSARMAHGTWLTCVRFSPDDQFIAAADSEGHLRFWETTTGKLLWQQPKGTGRKIAFSPDGKWLAVAGYYNPTISVWDLVTRRIQLELAQNARSLEFTPQGRLVAAGRDGIVRLWDPRSGKLIREFRGHQGELYSVAVSADGRRLASGGGNGGSSDKNEIRLWDLESGKQIAQLMDDNLELKKLPDAIYSLRFSSDGQTLGSSGPYVTRIWDIPKRQVVHRLRKCSYDVAFSPRAGRFVSCGQFGIYDARSGELVKPINGDVGVYGCLTYSHNGKWIASGNKQGYVQVWDAVTGKEINLRSGHEGGIRAAVFSPNGSLVASVSRDDATVRVWGATGGNQLLSFPIRWRGSDVWWNEEGSNLWFGPRGRTIVTWTSDLNLHFWDLTGRQRRLRLGTSPKKRQASSQSAVMLTVSSDGNRAAAVLYDSGSNSRVAIYELDGGRQLAVLDPFPEKKSSESRISSLAFAPDGSQLAIGALAATLEAAPAKSVQVWDLKSLRKVRSLRSSIAPPGRMCFSPDGRLLATSPSRGTGLQLWRVDDGDEVHQFQLTADAHGRDPVGLAFSPDSKLLAASDLSRDIFVWEVATREKIRTFRGHQKPVTSLVFSPDGNRLLSASEDATALLWSVRGDAGGRAKLTPEQLAGYWDALADDDAEVAAGAGKVLYHAPEQALELLRRQLDGGEPLDRNEIPVVVKGLASRDASKPLRAAARLKSFGKPASPALFQALAGTSDPTLRRRIEEVLEFIGRYPTPPADLRRNRAIQLLEQFGNDEAIEILQKIARKNPSTPAGRDARAALQRLSRRFKK